MRTGPLGWCRAAWRDSVGDGSAEVFGGLSHLPVAVFEGAIDGGVDLRALEWRQSEHGASSNGRLVGCCRDDRCNRSFVADGTERGNRRLPHQRILGGLGQLDQPGEDRISVRLVLATRPGGDLDDSSVVVVQRGDEIDVVMSRRDLGGAPANRCVGVEKGGCHLEVGERTESFERSERGRPHRGIVVDESAAGEIGVTEVAGDRNIAASGHWVTT